MDDPIVLYRGVTYARTFLIQRNGEALDLTDHTIASKIRTSPSSPQVAGEFECRIDDDPETGRFSILLSSSESQKLEAGGYTFDILLTYPTGENRIILVRGIRVVNRNTR